MTGDDAATATESGAFFFGKVTAENLKDCANNKVMKYEGVLEMNAMSALLSADIVADAKATDSKADFYGYQTKVADDKLSVRLVGYIDSLAYDKVGVKYQIVASNALNGKAYDEGILDTDTVYTSIKGETKTYANTDADAVYKDNYFFALTLADVAVEGDVTIVVTTFHVDKDGNEVIGETCIVSIDQTVA